MYMHTKVSAYLSDSQSQNDCFQTQHVHTFRP